MILSPEVQALVDQAQQLANDTGEPQYVCVTSIVDMNRPLVDGLVPTTLRWVIRGDRTVVGSPGCYVVGSCIPGGV